MSAGAFSAAVRAEIMARHDGKCVGCGQPATNAQHRVARGMGGGPNTLNHPANGIPLCGSGTTGCHGWAEAHPDHAVALGWRLPQLSDPTLAPYWSSVPPWRWNAIRDSRGDLRYVDEADVPLDQLQAAALAIEALRRT